MQILALALVVFTFLSPWLGSITFIVIVAMLEVWIILVNLSKIKVNNKNNKYTPEEVGAIEHYRLFFRYPFASKILSPVFSGIQLSVFVLVPWLIFKGLYFNAVVIGLNYFIASQLAVMLNPQFFLHDNVDKGKIKDPIQLLRFKQDMDVVDSALEKMYLGQGNKS